jgi:hypothetical protein
MSPLATRRAEFVGRLALAVSIGCMVLLVGTVVVLTTPSLRARFRSTPAPAYRVGDQIDVPARFYEGATTTLLIFARSSCSACEGARPVLTDLVAAMRSRSKAGVRFLPTDGLSPADADFARALGLDDSQIAPVDIKSLRLRVVPTVVVVDQQGIVRSAWQPPQPLTELSSLLSGLNE